MMSKKSFVISILFLSCMSTVFFTGCSRYTKPRNRVEIVQVPVAAPIDQASSNQDSNPFTSNPTDDYFLNQYGEGKTTIQEDVDFDHLDLSRDDVWVVSEITKRGFYYDDLATSNPDLYDALMSENAACGVVREFMQIAKKGNLINSAALRCNEIKDEFEKTETDSTGNERCKRIVNRAARVKAYITELLVDCGNLSRTMVDTLAKTQAMVSSTAVLYNELKIASMAQDLKTEKAAESLDSK